MNSIVEQKKALRRAIIDKKSKLTADYLFSSSSQITNTLINSEAFIRAKTIMCYLSFGTEVDTKVLIEQCLKQGKTILVPIIIKNSDDTSYMEASQLINYKEDLAPGILGILEPIASKIRIRDPKTIDLIIIPGLAFDKSGNRLGYGAGYYDYFLQRLRNDCKKIAITFSFQIVDLIPTEAHDQPIRNIITEKGLSHIE